MHCLDCHAQGATTPAVGICRACGAVCTNHARVITHEVHRRPFLAPPAETPVRSVRCFPCAGADSR
ncbi:DUF2180 family protein [Streptomyces erythrochromogenes]|uniref:DUF2180 family protein n=1 Tax=Streptomyces erythrochromogenes TaxID=285574 RepID=UPI003867F236